MDLQSTGAPMCPSLSTDAFQGFVREYVDRLVPRTEADRSSATLQFLAGFSNCIGRGAHYIVNGAPAYLNLSVVVAAHGGGDVQGAGWRGAFTALSNVD